MCSQNTSLPDARVTLVKLASKSIFFCLGIPLNSTKQILGLKALTSIRKKYVRFVFHSLCAYYDPIFPDFTVKKSILVLVIGSKLARSSFI